MIYSAKAKWLVIVLCVSYAIPLYSMNDELNDPVGHRSQHSYFSLGINSEWFSRYCPNFMRSDRYAHRIPVNAPTQPSSIATVPSKYSKKRIAMIAGLTLGAGVVGYYIGNTCQMCTDELRSAQRYVNELDDAFNACTDTTNYLTAVISNLTTQVAECVTSVDNLTEAIIEHCIK